MDGGGSGCILAIIGQAAAGWRRVPQLALYVILVMLVIWLYALAFVWWPHRSPSATPLQQTRGPRGRVIPALLFQHTYHLEHHLYPGVSSHRWAELGRRLEPHLAKAGVKLHSLP